MLYRGRLLDVLSLWGEHVELPHDIEDPLPTYLNKVVCPNPEHDTFKRHFQINTKKPWVHCFADCGISGTYEHALCVVLGIYDKHDDDEEGKKRAHREARRLILRHTRIALGRAAESLEDRRGSRKSVAADSEVARDERALSGGAFQFLPKNARAYLDLRGIDPSSRGKWQLGFDEDEERLVIPAYDERGRFRFLIKRKIAGGGYQKYLYTKGTLKTAILFGACYVDRSAIRSHGLVLCEGPLDCIRLHQLGIETAVAILGTGLSKQQIRLVDKLDPKRVYLFFDKDPSGVTNILAAAKGRKDVHRGLTKCPLFVCRFPKHRGDPAEMTREEVQRSIERAMPIHQFLRKAKELAVA
jgi:hypothetical protein